MENSEDGSPAADMEFLENPNDSIYMTLYQESRSTGVVFSPIQGPWIVGTPILQVRHPVLCLLVVYVAKEVSAGAPVHHVFCSISTRAVVCFRPSRESAFSWGRTSIYPESRCRSTYMPQPNVSLDLRCSRCKIPTRARSSDLLRIGGHL